MLRARWYKVINDLFGNKTRTLLIVLSMSVGLFALGIILSARTILSDGLAESFATINPSSGTVRTAELFDEDFIQSVRSMEDVQEVDARSNISARVQTASGEWKNITIFVVADYEDIRVNKVASQSGAWPPPEREILIERAALSVIDAQIGDVILVRFPNDVERRVRIAGSAYDPAQLPAQLDGTPYGYITFDTLKWFGEAYGFNELHVIATHPEDKDWAQQVVNRVKDKAEKSGYTIPLSMTAEPGQLPMNDVLQGILLVDGIARRAVAFPEHLPRGQYGVCVAHPAKAADRRDESSRRKHASNSGDVSGDGAGLRCDGIADRHSAWGVWRA